MIKAIFAMVEAGSLDRETALALIERAEAHARRGGAALRDTFRFDEPYLRDHTVFGERLLLGVTYCSLAMEGFTRLYGADLLRGVGHLTFLSPVRLQPGESADVTLTFRDRQEAAFTCDYAVAGADARQGQAARGIVLVGPVGPTPPPIALEELQRAATGRQAGSDIYARVQAVKYGSALRTIQEVYSVGGKSLARLKLQRHALDETRRYSLHPALLDGALLSVMSAALLDGEAATYIPLFVERFESVAAVGDDAWVLGEITKRTDEIVSCDLVIANPDGAVAATIRGFSTKRVRDVSRLVASITSGQQPSDPALASPEPTPPLPATPDVPLQASTLGNAALQDKVGQYLERLLAQALGGAAGVLDRKTNFMDLGLESNQLVRISATLEQEVGIELFPTVFFEHQNIAEMTRYLVSEHGDSFARRFGAPPARAQPVPAVAAVRPAAGPAAARAADPQPRDEIAVIGMAGIFAGSPDLSAFWRHIEAGTDLMSEIPRNRFDCRPWFDSTGRDPEKLYCKWGSFIHDVDRFDAAFFNVSQREAEVMDPQLRHLLQVLYWTAEDAGRIGQLRGSRTGVYVGACFYDYQAAMLDDGKPVEVFDGIGNSPTMLSNRPSFYFDLKGPSLTVDTACSSSLVAAHLARQALMNGECDMAFVAGVNLLLSPRHYQYFCRLKALGRSGRCHSFDAAADGYVPGEGIGAVLLKPLAKAVADGDQIHGILKGSAIGHGGHSSTITAPSVRGEEQVIVAAWQDAGVDPRTIDYIEAHGTGTALGDPIEFQATERAFRRFTDEDARCAIGSAKAHIGHLEGAAGIAALIKTLLALRARKIPAMPRFERLNPFIKAGRSPLFVNRETLDWTASGHPRRAGISSFGFGGSFAHLVVEEHLAAPRPDHQDSDGPALIVLSAQSPEQLATKASRLRAFLATPAGAEARLEDIAYTLQVGRQAMPHRLAFVAASKLALDTTLAEVTDGQPPSEEMWSGQVGHNRAIVELFEDDAGLGEVLAQYLHRAPDLSRVGRLWAEGFPVAWQHLHRERAPRIVGLPVHPFAAESYWYKPLPDSRDDEAFQAALAGAADDQAIAPVTDLVAQHRQLDALAAEGLLAHLKPLGLFDRLAGGRVDLGTVARDLSIAPEYVRFLQSAIAALAEQGLLVQAGSGYELAPAEANGGSVMTPETFADRAEGFALEHPGLRPFAALLNACLAQLRACLQGEIQGTDVLFKGGAATLVESVYRGNPIADHFNDQVAAFVAAYVASWVAARELDGGPGGKMTILEIGAGTGGASARTLERLAPFAAWVDYVATDVSPVFLAHLERTLSPRYPFLRTALFDLERPCPAALRSGSQLIVGANVLHATTDVGRSLDNVAACLEPGGALILNELTRNQTFLTATFGLLKGWWLYEDEAERLPGGPLLSTDGWRAALDRHGFCEARALESTGAGQDVIVAQFVGARSRTGKAAGQSEGPAAPLASADRARGPAHRAEVGGPAAGSAALAAILELVAAAARTSPDQIDTSASFLDLGLDSLVSVEFVAHLNKRLGVALQTTDILDHPSPARLAEHLDGMQAGAANGTARAGGGAPLDPSSDQAQRVTDLKAKTRLKSKTEIDKLFDAPGDGSKRVGPEEALFQVLDAERVTAELIPTTAGVSLEVVRAGRTGPGLVLLPPLNTLALVWHNQIEAFARDHRVLSIHYPGFGRSGFRQPGFGMADIGRLIVEVLGALGVDDQPYHLMGWSMGGLIAQAIAESEKQRVGTLTLVGTGTISMFDDDYYNDHTHIKQILDREIAHEAVHPALKRDHKLLVGTYDSEVLLRYAAEIRDFDHRRARAIQAPVLVLNGDEDRVLLPKYARAMAGNFPLVAYREIAGGGHFLPLTHPDRINEHLAQFVRRGRQYLNECGTPTTTGVSDEQDA